MRDETQAAENAEQQQVVRVYPRSGDLVELCSILAGYKIATSGALARTKVKLYYGKTPCGRYENRAHSRPLPIREVGCSAGPSVDGMWIL